MGHSNMGAYVSWGKIAASDCLKLFINGNERGNTINAHFLMGGTLFSNQNNIPSMITEDQKIQLHNDVKLEHGKAFQCT